MLISASVPGLVPNAPVRGLLVGSVSLLALVGLLVAVQVLRRSYRPFRGC